MILKRIGVAFLSVCMLFFLIGEPLALATEDGPDGTVAGQVTLDFSASEGWQDNGDSGYDYTVDVVAMPEGDAASFDVNAIEVCVHFDPAVLTLGNVVVAEKVQPVTVGDESVSMSARVIKTQVADGYFTLSFTGSMDYDVNFHVNRGDSIGTIHFTPVSVPSQSSILSFSAVSGRNTRISYYDAELNNSRYSVNTNATHTVPALNPSNNNVTVTLNPGTGSDDEAQNVSAPVGSYTLPENPFTPKTNYTFLNWLVGEETKNPNDTITLTANNNITITAQWDAPVTVTLNPGEGSDDETQTFSLPVGGTYTLPNAPQPKPNYTFLNWRVGNESKNPGDVITVNANTDITAAWNGPVTVTLNPGEGSNGTARTDTLAMGSTYTLPPANTFAPKSDRYIFRAWRVGDAERLPDQTITLSANIEITAQWDELVTVTLNPGAGSNDTARTETRVKGSTYTLPSADTFRAIDGYTFRNWKVGDEAKSPNETIVLNADTVITAEWNEPTPQVTVTWNPGTGSDDAARTESRDKDSTFALPGNFFRPRSSLYSFKDWLVNGVVKNPGDVITLSADTTITAEWNEPQSYTVIVNNGTGGGEYQPGETVRITAPATSGGNAFTGWLWTGPENFSISDVTSNEATFTMPASNVSFTPSYGGCYVATAVYGSYDCPEVWTLRRFRDQVLAKTWYGRLFIHLYYAVSPTAVRLFGQTSLFQNFFRSILDPWVANLQSDGFESTPYNDMPW